SLSAGRSAAPPARLVDSLGDPLPPGAMARLGSTRLRHPGPVYTVLFTRDGKQVISGGYDSKGGKLLDGAGPAPRRLGVKARRLAVGMRSPAGCFVRSIRSSGSITCA